MSTFSKTALVTALLAFGPYIPAVAQDADLSGSSAQAASGQRLESVLVTGTRRAYRGDFAPLETPQSEFLIDSLALERAGVDDLVQALDLSGSVARQNNFGGLWNAFAVRGFAGDENLPSNYLVNGFNAGRGFSGPRDISGIEAVEVLKGPKAALYGRGEPGGTINLITKRPTFENRSEVRVSYGRYDAMRADADFDIRLGDDAGLRLVGFTENAESFRDTIETSRHGLSPSLAVNLSDRTNLLYEIEYADQEIPFDRGTLAINGELGLVSRNHFFGEPGDGPLQAEVLGHQLELEHEFNDSWRLLAGINHRDTSLTGYSSEAELSGSRQLLRRDGQTLTRQRRLRNYDAIFQAFRAELTGDLEAGGISHRILIGGDFDEFENDQVFRRYRSPSLAGDPSLEQLYVIDVFTPQYGRWPLPAVGPLTDRLETQQAFGFYVQDQISFSERVQIRVGLRYDDFDQTNNNRRSGSVFELSDSRLSPQAGIVFNTSNELALYASYGEGFRQLTGTDFFGNGFSPNTTNSFETGLKWAPENGRMLLTAAWFNIEQDNILVGDPEHPYALLAAGAAESSGIELDISGQIADGLDVLFSYAYIDAEMTTPALDPNFNLPIEAGAPLINIPDHNLSLRLTRSWEVAGRPVSAGAGVLHIDDRLGETATQFMLPGYSLFDIFAEYGVSDTISLRAEVKNLFDEEYYTNSFARLWVQPGWPRFFRVSATLSF